ncbi:hypothetical protein [Xanthobacter sediminis]|uniref:hypothetical protein n=1 Tax=Xanthobacter sediminis TaxID=3119926 RepID=UPI00372CAA8B
MTFRAIRVLLLSGVAACLVGGAAAQGSAGKTQDRLPVAASTLVARPLLQVAELDTPPGVLPPPEAGGPLFASADALAAPPPPAPGARPQGAPGPRRPGPPSPRPDPLGYARALAGAETAIGIRADQLDAWRDLTDALQASLPSPRPAAAPTGETPPFTAVDTLAGRLQEQGRTGERLARAVAALKARLTPEQLERVARLGPALLPPPGGRFPPPPGGPGPGTED